MRPSLKRNALGVAAGVVAYGTIAASFGLTGEVPLPQATYRRFFPAGSLSA